MSKRKGNSAGRGRGREVAEAGREAEREEIGRRKGYTPEQTRAEREADREEGGKRKGGSPEPLRLGAKQTDEGAEQPRARGKQADEGAPSAALLPHPAELLRKEPKVKVTITLNTATVDFFKRHAEENGVKYQTMINELLDRYMRLF